MATEKKADYMVDNGTDFDQIMFKTIAEQVRYSKDDSGKETTVEDEIASLKVRLKNKIMVEQITVKGIGESYFYIGDKTGYVLMNVYNYAREYNTADVVRISHNVAQKIYYVFVEQVQPTTSSMALRLFWLATD